MTINRYAFVARPGYQVSYMDQALALTKETLTRQLAGAIVRQLVAHEDGSHEIELQLQRSSHPDALTEIADVLPQFGLDFAQAVITEVVTNAAEGAILGRGGSAFGGAATKNPWAALLITAMGTIGGAAVGSLLETVVARYEAHRDPYTGWTLQRLDRLVGAPLAGW